MTNHYQLVIYEGYLGADPQMRYTPQGKAVTNFSMGSTRQYKTSDGTEVKETTWIKVTVWGKTAEIVNQYCAKGAHVQVTGRLKPGEKGSPEVFEMKNGGFGASYEVTCDTIRIYDGNKTDVGKGEVVAEEENLPY